MHLVTGALGSDVRDLRDSHRDLATSHRALGQEVGELASAHRPLASDVRTAQAETLRRLDRLEHGIGALRGTRRSIA